MLFRSTHANRLSTIQSVYAQHHEMIDTHTADGVKVAREYRKNGIPMLVLETALPIKFADTIQEALGQAPICPPKFAGIELLPKRVHVMKADVEQIKKYIASHCERA